MSTININDLYIKDIINYSQDDLLNLSMFINLSNNKSLNNNILKIILYYYKHYENNNNANIYSLYYNKYKLIYEGDTTDLTVSKFNLNNFPNQLITLIYKYILSLY